MSRKESTHYALLTGLSQVEEGPDGRALSVVACMKAPGHSRGDEAEAEGVFFVDPARLPKGDARILCRSCGERHDLYSLLDAFGKQLLPSDQYSCNVDVPVGIDALTRNAVRWLRKPQVSSATRKAS